MSYKDGKLHPEIQAAVDTRPAVLEPWGMFHILEACDKIAQERDALKAELAQRAEAVAQAWDEGYAAAQADARKILVNGQPRRSGTKRHRGPELRSSAAESRSSEEKK